MTIEKSVTDCCTTRKYTTSLSPPVEERKPLSVGRAPPAGTHSARIALCCLNRLIKVAVLMQKIVENRQRVIGWQSLMVKLDVRSTENKIGEYWATPTCPRVLRCFFPLQKASSMPTG